MKFKRIAEILNSPVKGVFAGIMKEMHRLMSEKHFP